MCAWLSESVYICVFLCGITGNESVDRDKSKTLTLLLMATFPRQRLAGRDSKSLPLCFSAFCPSLPSIPSSQSAPWQYAGLISKQKVLSGKSLQRQTQFGYSD